MKTISSHFVTCQAVEDEKGRVICRFNNISDLNLLLFNKVKSFLGFSTLVDVFNQGEDAKQEGQGDFLFEGNEADGA